MIMDKSTRKEVKAMVDASLKLNELEVVDHEQKVLDMYGNFWNLPEDMPEKAIEDKLEAACEVLYNFVKQQINYDVQQDNELDEFVFDCVYEGFSELTYCLDNFVKETVRYAFEQAPNSNKDDEEVHKRFNVIRLMMAMHMYYYIVKRLGVAIDKYENETGKHLVLRLTSESPEIEKAYRTISDKLTVSASTNQ
jgi:hypothetical protein